MNMVTKRQKIAATVFEVVCVWPLLLLVLVALTVIFLALLPYILYAMARKRWWMTDYQRTMLEAEAARKNSWDD
jgi:hypothetical protein